MAISASIMGSLFIGVSLNVIAQRIPFLNNVFGELKNNKSSETMSILFNEYIDKYSQSINQAVTSNGITVTAEKVVCDGSNLYVSYIILNCIIKSDKYINKKDTYDILSLSLIHI